ncbi:MAG: hypothetical protein JOZ57_18655, partial [Abitibacteriaceae bacterium]|nr:hypothetical protein [Abditibacteriaceae bacterium]
MHTADVAQVAALSEQLGYPTTAAHIAQRFQALSHNQGHGFFVATHDKNNKALGWVHIYGVHLLETEGYAEIGGLVVDS